MVTIAPVGPDEGLKVEITGGGMTVKLTPLLANPPTLTATFPDWAPVGTGATMLVSLQLVGRVGTPLNVTSLDPLVAPKLVPLMVTEVPGSPDEGLKLVMLGGTSKNTPLLATPPTVTRTFPPSPRGTGTTMAVELQLVGVATIPPKVTVLLPCDAPKFVPVMVTDAPAKPEFGLIPVILGPGLVTVNVMPLLAIPPTVTTTLPVVAPVGTGTAMTVGLQLVGDPLNPLKVTVPVACVIPKFVPVIVTDVPAGPDAGLRLETVGGRVTVNTKLLLA